MPAITIPPGALYLVSRRATPPAPSVLAYDTGDGGLIVPDRGYAPDHDQTYVLQYQVEGDATVRDCVRETWGTAPVQISVAGYRTARAHDMTGSPSVRWRQVVDGAESGWTGYTAYTVTSPTPTTASSVSVGSDSFAITASLDATYTVQESQHQRGYWFVVAPSGCTINSVSPAKAFYVKFDSGGTTAIGAGATITTAGGFSGVAAYVGTFGDGSWGAGNQEGWITFAAGYTGTINDNDVLLIGGVDRATASTAMRYYNGSAKNPRATTNVFMAHDTAPISDPDGAAVTFQLAMSPGDIFVHQSADRTELTGNSVFRRQLVIACVSALPAAGLLPPAPYRTNGGPLQRIMMHESLWRAANCPSSASLPNLSEASRNAIFDDEIGYVGAFFRSGSIETRVLAPSLHVAPYHRETAFGRNKALALALSSNVTESERERFLRACAARIMFDVHHNQVTRHDYWWQGQPLVIGATAGIWELAAARKSWLYQAADYDGIDGSDYLSSQPPPDDLTVSMRFRGWSDMATHLPSHQWQSRTDAATYSALSADRTITFSPSVAAQEPIIPGVVDNGDGTWTIPGERGFFGERASGTRIAFMDHRPASPGGIAYANVTKTPGGDYRVAWTDGENSIGKIRSYTWQHDGSSAMTYLFEQLCGLDGWVNTYRLSDAAEDYMGMTTEWIAAVSLDGTYNGGPLSGSFAAQATNTHVSATAWWNALNAGQSSPWLSPGAAPAKPARPRFTLTDQGDSGTIRLRIKAWPEEVGNRLVTAWQISLNGGAATTVSNGYVQQAIDLTGAVIGRNFVQVRAQNASGWGPWSAPKTVTVAP